MLIDLNAVERGVLLGALAVAKQNTFGAGIDFYSEIEAKLRGEKQK